ncbi:MAG: POTRA domain-containing protein, partial [Deltaproteobacteria bacterium]
MNKKPFLLCFVFTLITWLLIGISATSLFAGQTKRIAIMPFDAFSNDSATIRTTVFDSVYIAMNNTVGVELIDKKVVLETIGNITDASIGITALTEKERADFIVYGEITKFGDQINMDVRIWDASISQFLRIDSIQGRGIEMIKLAILAQLKKDILFVTGIEKRINMISISGNNRIETAAIMQNVKSAKGALFSPEGISNDIKAIFKMGYFNDVVANVTEFSAGNVITYIVKEKPLIKAIEVEGSDKIDVKQILGVMSTKNRDVLNPGKFSKDIEKIKSLYHSKGYYNAEISVAYENSNETIGSEVVVRLNIIEKKKMYITTLTIVGNSAFNEDELKEEMKTKEKHLFSFLDDRGILKQEELQQDTARVEAFYVNNGFIYAKVGAPKIAYTADGINIVIEIQEGQRYRVGNVSIKGDALKISNDKLLEMLTISKKEFFDRSALIKDREKLERIANDDGFAFASINPLHNITDELRSVDITYQIVKGPP